MKRSYIKNVLVGFDKFLNALIWGNPDETISSRSYRRGTINGIRKWAVIENLIDAIFFWDKVQTKHGIVRHCQKAFLMELRRKQHGLTKKFSQAHQELIDDIYDHPEDFYLDS